MERTVVTVAEVAADPTNTFEVRVSGDTAIRVLKLKGSEAHPWVYVEYASGGSCAGCPAHWAQYVRYDDELMAVHRFYPDAVDLVLSGWTTAAAIAHVTGMCDREICGGEHE